MHPPACRAERNPNQIRPKSNQPRQDWGWGVVVSVMRRARRGTKQPAADPADSSAASVTNGAPAESTASAAALPDPAQVSPSDPPSYYIVDTLLACAPGSAKAGAPRPAGSAAADITTTTSSKNGDQDDAEAVVLPVSLPLIFEFSSLRVALPGDLRPADAR
jgi:hypothetical protein